jgi:hypothetical protein
MGSWWTDHDYILCFRLLQNCTVETQAFLSKRCHYICKGWGCQPIPSSETKHLWGLRVTLLLLSEQSTSLFQKPVLQDQGFYSWFPSLKVKSQYLTNWAVRCDGVWGSGCIDPYYLDLGTSWRWVVSFTPQLLYHQKKSPWYPLDRRLGGPQDDVEYIKFLTLSSLKLWPLGRPTHSQSLYWLC